MDEGCKGGQWAGVTNEDGKERVKWRQMTNITSYPE